MDASMLAELLGFLSDARADVRKLATEHVLSLTGTDEGINSLIETDVCTSLVRLLGDVGDISKNAANALINLSVNERIINQLLNNKVFWSSLLSSLTAKECGTREECLKLLQNITRSEDGAQRLLEGRLGKEHIGHDFLLLVGHFVQKPNDEAFDRVAQIITNITQVDEGRDIVLDPKRDLVGKIMPHLSSPRVLRREGVAGALKNVCLEVETHKKLITQTKMIPNILKRLLTSDGIDDEEDLVGMHPIVVDELNNPDLAMEPEVSVRQLLIETLILLGSTRKGREELRSQQAYPIVKRYHLQETDEPLNEKVYDLVDFLLGDEDAEEIEESEEINELRKEVAKASVEEVPEEQEDEKPVIEVGDEQIDTKETLWEID